MSKVIPVNEEKNSITDETKPSSGSQHDSDKQDPNSGYDSDEDAQKARQEMMDMYALQENKEAEEERIRLEDLKSGKLIR